VDDQIPPPREFRRSGIEQIVLVLSRAATVLVLVIEWGQR
jgi:hypothetical protein